MMAGTVWTKFFWSDWLSDVGLRRCSIAARGLWMDMLCIAAGHDPIGYVAVQGEGLSETEIAKLACLDSTTCSTLISELERNGVFSRDHTGTIYSRRMIRDEKKASKARKNGKNGGNPSLIKQRGNSTSDKGRITEALTDALSPICHKPESISQIDSSSGSSAVQSGAGPPVGRSELDRIEEAIQSALPDGVPWPVRADPDLSPIVMAIKNGADLEVDIIPAIRDASARRLKAGDRVTTWRFFVRDIDAHKKARKTAGSGEKSPADPAERQRLLESSWRFILKQAATNGIVDIVARNRKIPPEFVAKWKAEQAEKLGKSA